MDYAKWLRSTRRSRSPVVSQEALAVEAQKRDPADVDDVDAARFSQARVSEWERGESLPSLRQHTVLCFALECSDAEARAGRGLWDAAQLVGLPAPAGVVDASGCVVIPADQAEAIAGLLGGETLSSIG